MSFDFLCCDSEYDSASHGLSHFLIYMSWTFGCSVRIEAWLSLCRYEYCVSYMYGDIRDRPVVTYIVSPVDSSECGRHPRVLVDIDH